MSITVKHDQEHYKNVKLSSLGHPLLYLQNTELPVFILSVREDKTFWFGLIINRNHDVLRCIKCHHQTQTGINGERSFYSNYV